jgi:hypothetical protein
MTTSSIYVIFASTGLDLPPASKVPKLVASDLILIIGLAALLFGVFVTWIVFVRGPRKHPSERNGPKLATPKTATDDGRERRRKKKRSRRRDHRQRNPTLSQTGGLPPPRDPEEEPAI